jgi:hypothetical protein
MRPVSYSPSLKLAAPLHSGARLLDGPLNGRARDRVVAWQSRDGASHANVLRRCGDHGAQRLGSTISRLLGFIVSNRPEVIVHEEWDTRTSTLQEGLLKPAGPVQVVTAAARAFWSVQPLMKSACRP